MSVSFNQLVHGKQTIEEFPKTLKATSKLVGIDPNTFVEYIVCPKCNSVFDYKFGYTVHNNEKFPVKCPNIEYPNHPHASKRKPCGTYLMKIAKTRTGTTTLRPHKVYAYQPLKTALTNLVNRTGFLDVCEQWRSRCETIPNGLLCDIFDGQVWKEFQTIDGSEFLKAPFNFAFTLNTDWFQPYSHTRK